MVEFEMTMGGFKVLVGLDRKTFGYISRNEGFFTDPTTIQKFMIVSSDDLREIARKTDEVRRGGL
ncbi:MAG: hypothetical protein Q8R29_03975 [bacterium]|nr:hypothetical protein [bacterium]